MAPVRTPLLIPALLASFGASAHPGHAAPPIHVHDVDLMAAALAAMLLAAVIAFCIRARYQRRHSRAEYNKARDDRRGAG